MYFKAIILGCLTGFISAFFGIGGSSIDTPLLRLFFNLPPYIALGTPLPLTLLTATIASFAYRREHLVNFRIALLTSIAGVIFYSVIPAKGGMATSPDWFLGFLFGIGGFIGIYLGARFQKFVP